MTASLYQSGSESGMVGTFVVATSLCRGSSEKSEPLYYLTNETANLFLKHLPLSNVIKA